MGRPGIRYQDVATAAQQLSGQGQHPTIDSVRQLLGTGSTSTIAPHLRAWKARQDQTRLIANKEQLPEELVALIKGLWERVIGQAEVQVSAIQQQADQQVSESRQHLQSMEQENKGLQQRYHQLQHTCSQLTHDKLGIEQALIQLRNDHTALQSDVKNFNLRFTDQQARIDGLQRINQQTQANLEHYREVMCEQRLKEQQHYEREIELLKQAVAQSLQELTQLKNQHQFIQEKYQQLQHDFQALQKESHETGITLREVKSQFSAAQEKLTASEQAARHWQAQSEQCHRKTEEQQGIIVNFQNQMILLSQQLIITEKQRDEINQENQSLAHDKWILGQEKAQLLGQLRQLECIKL